MEEVGTHMGKVVADKLTLLETILHVNCATSMVTLFLNIGTSLMLFFNMLIKSIIPKDQLTMIQLELKALRFKKHLLHIF